MLLKLSKQEVRALEDFKEFIDKTNTAPFLWKNQTEWNILKDRFKQVLEKITKQTDGKKL